MRKILITGGAGFVGRHFTRHFLEAGDEVHVVDSIEQYTGGIDPAVGWPLFDPRDYANFKFEKIDCRNYFRRPGDTEYDYALHLAAMVGGRLMIENNPLVVADDLSIDAAYWQWAKLARPQKNRLLQLERGLSDQASAPRALRFARRRHDRFRRRYWHAGHVLRLG